MGSVPSGLILPDYARVDLAWEETRALQYGDFGQRVYQYRPISGHIEVPRMLFYTAVTGAATGGRSVLVDLINVDGLIVFEIVSPVTIGTANTNTNYSHMVDVPILQTVNTNVQILPLPSFFMNPGDVLQAGWGGGFADDTVVNGSITVIHVPTGPPAENEQRILIPRTLLH